MPQLATNNLCTGCSACVTVCPSQCLSMKTNENGFLYPVVLEQGKCLNCGLCEKACPILEQKKLEGQNTIAYAAYSLDESVRAHSSSGGIFTEVAQSVLAQGGKIYGAAYTRNFAVHHVCVTMREELEHLRGAKYAQSDLEGCFIKIKKQIKNGTRVLFIGTPCQVAGLKSFLKKDYNNLVCVDFVCHGVPSPMAWEKYVKYRAEQDNEGIMPTRINLRSKHTGWSRYQYSNLYEYTDKRYSAGSGADLFMRLFVENFINRESCSNCPFKGYNRVSDLTIADFWGIWDIMPDMDDDKGTSLVLVHSDKGKKLMSDILDRLVIKSVTLQQASQQNPSLLVASEANKKRKEVLDLIRSDRFDEVEEVLSKCLYNEKPAKVRSKIVNILRRFR